MSSRARKDATPREPGAPPVAQRPPEPAERSQRTGDADTRPAPSIVHETISSPGAPLDAGTRAFMEARFGYDFSRVRVHSDDRAARSAAAVDALAYTVGNDIAFGPDLYRPHTADGRALLAHELAHVVQDGSAGVQGALRVGGEQDAAEREATADATHAMSSASHGSGERSAGGARRSGARTTVLRRTTAGALLGGGIGLLGGALLGALLGPVGAVVGGLVGFAVGAAIGERATTRSRPLSQSEIAYARDVFVDSIDYGRITITRDSVLALGAPRTIGNTIHLKSDWGHFVRDTLELSERGRQTLIHEMGHVWQYQNGGLAYMPLSIIAQIRAAASSGDRNAAYNWRAAHDAGTPWEDWNPEQQASAIEDYNDLLRKQRAGTATVPELHVLSVLLPYIDRVRRRQGAPGAARAGARGAGATRGASGATP